MHFHGAYPKASSLTMTNIMPSRRREAATKAPIARKLLRVTNLYLYPFAAMRLFIEAPHHRVTS